MLINPSARLAALLPAAPMGEIGVGAATLFVVNR
jgi:hypothetical protein